MSETAANGLSPDDQHPPSGCSLSEWRIFGDYYDRLVRRAEQLLSKRRKRVSNGDDIASIVLYNFFRKRRDGAIVQDADDDLWPRLALMVRREVFLQIRKELRIKRGLGRVRGESVFANANWNGPAGFDLLAHHAPTAEEAALAIETVDALFSRLSEEESRVAAARLEGYTVPEIAERLGCSVSSVERRLRLLRAKLKT